VAEEIRFEIGNKAEQLYFSVFDITTNRKHYPVKFRRLADSLQACVLDIHSNVLNANAIKTDSALHKARKYDLQTQAVSDCNKFLSLIKYSLHAGLISFATSETWTDLAHDIKYMILAWRRT
jgi:hypothetical protein